MEVILKYNKEHFEAEKLSISEVLEIKKYSFKMLITKVNGNFISRENYANTYIYNGDNVSIIHLISGG